MQVPTIPQTGKNAKVSMNFNDGTSVTALALTKQASYNYKGETLVNRVFLLGDEKMINSRPAANPFAFVNGIIDGSDVSSTVSDELIVSAGNNLIANVVTAVTAKTDLAVTRPAAGEARWVGIVRSTVDGTVSEVAGTDTTAGTGKTALLTTIGAAAGEKPLIPVASVLVCYLGIDATSGVITSDEVDYSLREWSTISYQLDASLGAIIVAEAFPIIHTGTLSRPLYFTGKYWESTAIALVGDAQKWNIADSSSSVEAVTFSGGASETQVSGQTFGFDQLFTDAKALDAVRNRQGYCAIKLELPSGHYFLFVGSISQSLNCDPGSFVIQNITGSVQGQPTWSGD